MSSSIKPARLLTGCVPSTGHWDSMEEYTCMIPRDTHDGAFYRAVLALHQDLFSLAQQVSCGAAELEMYINRCLFLEKKQHGGAAPSNFALSLWNFH